MSDYLDASAVEGEPAAWVFARLNTDHEAAIKAKVAVLKRTLRQRFGWTYRRVMEAAAAGEWSDIDVLNRHHDLLELASRIDLGMHLLQTIRQMRRQGITEQGLLIELM